MKTIIKLNQNKFKNIFFSLVMMVIFIILAFMFKMINQAINGTSEWKEIFESQANLVNRTDLSWFANGKITTSFFTGPVGSKSFSEFNLLYSVNGGYIFLLPIFWDLLINWILIVGIAFIFGFIIYEFFKNNKMLKIKSISNQQDKFKKSNNVNEKARKINSKKRSKISEESATMFISKMEEKYEKELSEDEIEFEKDEKLSIAERSKIDGSDKISEKRYELQKYSNKLRSVSIEKNLSKKLQEVNLRNLTKRELITYMKKVKNEIAN
ncbi:SSU ribosomal protein S6p hypothetical protein [Mesoplasma florum W37]|uniref:SSU ribosomal protein S6p n=1 Tax=Mesoplasma florum TaxID=2151 RepID=A0AAD0MR02_MESFO|nr:hypothetical protein [Mesoplasma florum]AGY41659.1 SSU ribosomal protein S6p hypothetical protein [Mesoplasma florum W37]AVN59863.1 hypothetical protein CG008_03130 [Mesoplasma florum]AVN65997.1 SSU ribosomal protein S6p [Mesoplasma florum]